MKRRRIQIILGIILVFLTKSISANIELVYSDTLPNQKERDLLGNGPVCENRVKYCQGHRRWADGSVYEGEFKFGKPEGLGVYIWPNGNRYTGKWKNGLKDGYGIMKYFNGEQYDGEWKNGKK